LTEDHINELNLSLKANNEITFNQLDVEQEIQNVLQENNFKYNAISGIFEKTRNISSIKSYDSLIIKNQQIIENYTLQQRIINKNKASKILAKQGLAIDVINDDQKIDSFVLFDFVLDNNNNKIKINKQFLSYLESKIKDFPNGSFSNYIVSLFKNLNSDYDNTNDFKDLRPSINYLFYIVNFYESILK
jgi:hypothetical protein